jgi:hypothetical protein
MGKFVAFNTQMSLTIHLNNIMKTKFTDQGGLVELLSPYVPKQTLNVMHMAD